MTWKIVTNLIAFFVFSLIVFQNCQGNNAGPLSGTSLNSESSAEDTYEIYIKPQPTCWQPPAGSQAPSIPCYTYSLDIFIYSVLPEFGKTITYQSSTCMAYPSDRCCTLKVKRNSGALEKLKSNTYVEHIEPVN